MTRYISLDALVAEIERRKKEWSYGSSTEAKYKVEAYKELIEWLDTLEVKEVDLEKEIEKYAYSLPHSVTGTTSYVSDIKSPKARMFGIRHGWSYKYVEQIAEHFYELGLKAQKG